MNGLTQESTECFQRIARGETAGQGNALREVAARVSEYQGASDRLQRAEAHRNVIKALGSILHPEGHGVFGPCLYRECPRCDRYREATDSPVAGYSRDPFKQISPEHMPQIALAAISYLMRAHSFFFHRPRESRSFNAAKVALNDLFQATQLACRLYYSLPECHTRVGSYDKYMDRVRRDPDTTEDPWLSPFFVWTILHFVEIQRGNIYRHLQYLEEADRHYRHVQKRFHRLVGDPLAVNRERMVPAARKRRSTDVWFVTPTLVRAFAEMSKVLFDRGLFLDSMMCQIQCLAFIARMNSRWSPRKKEDLDEISQGLHILDVARKESVWDKDSIHQLFTKKNGKDSLFSVLLSRHFIARIKRRTDAELVAGLYARIGLTLFILRSKYEYSALPTWDDNPTEKPEDNNERQVDFLRFFSVHQRLGISPPAIVHDARSMFGEAELLTAAYPPHDSRERSLARSLREAIGRSDPIVRPLDRAEFYAAVLKVAIQNILNIVTIPRRIQSFFIRPGYKERRTIGDLGGKTVADSLEAKKPAAKDGEGGKPRNKFVVLRRWQSFNPKIPRPHAYTVRGGGYFLMWEGKGIAIDPGYDFLQNFYDEGFSIGDIDAIVVTHSHPDHEDDLSTLSTLVREWNEYFQHMGREERTVKLDLFLNESAHLKFSNWLKASQADIGRVIPLPLVAWDLNSKDPTDRNRGTNVRLNLRKTYHFDLEVVPAWHDDVIGKTAAIGVKFHLYSSADEPRIGVVGYTGDTGAYPWNNKENNGENKNARMCAADCVEDYYRECNVLIAHLGDVRLRELFSAIDPPGKDPKLGLRVGDLLCATFCKDGHALKERLDPPTKVEDFFSLLVTLQIAQKQDLEAIIDDSKYSKSPPVTVAMALNRYIRGEPLSLQHFCKYKDVVGKLVALAKRYDKIHINENIEKYVRNAIAAGAQVNPEMKDWQIAYALLGFLCSVSLSQWRYDYHLGITGLYRMQRALLKSIENDNSSGGLGGDRILVVGELPEELASYRHLVARLLNFTKGNFDREGRRRVHAFTGDIGLHISLECASHGDPQTLEPKIRCAYCNYNNETVLELRNYHRPEHILETPLKRLNSAMIYLCIAHDHHPEAEGKPHDFLSRPALRVI